MGKLEEAKGILSAIGMPDKQTNDRSAYVLLALSDIKETADWNEAVSRSTIDPRQDSPASKIRRF